MIAIASTSCTTNKKYAGLQGKYDSLQTDYNSTREDLINCNADTRNLQQQLETARRTMPS